MLNSLSYKLTREGGTKSEQIFFPNNQLVDFLKNNNKSRIIRIQASNSKGKTFLLNLIAFSLYGLQLERDELIPTLRTSLDSLIDTDHQKLDFNIMLADPSGSIINSSINSDNTAPKIIKIENNVEREISVADFIKEYKLVYDIPEKPLQRIFQLIKDLKKFNNSIIDKLIPIDDQLDETLKLIDDERNETKIKELQINIKNCTDEIVAHDKSIILNKKELEDLTVFLELKKLKERLNIAENNSKTLKDLELKFSHLKEPKGDDAVEQNGHVIREIKANISNLNLNQLFNGLDVIFTTNNYGINLLNTIDDSENELLSEIKETLINIENIILEYDIEKISKLESTLKTFKNYSLDKIFSPIENKINLKDYDLVKILITNFTNSQKDGNGEYLASNVFKKSISEIINELQLFAQQYSEVENISSLKTLIASNIENVLTKIISAKSLAKKLMLETSKQKKAPQDFKEYYKIKEKILEIKEAESRQEEKLKEIKSILKNNNAPKIDFDNKNKVNELYTSYYNLLKKFDGIETTRIKEVRSELTVNINIQEKSLKEKIEYEFKLEREEGKNTSKYTNSREKIQLFSNKLSYFLQWLKKKNATINEDGALNLMNLKENESYFKIVGEYVASVLENKILYQDKFENITFVDYTSKIPSFVTDSGKRISFTDFSGGQQSSNYLKSKLNLNESRKHIVLFDEVSNMDNKSLNEVIERLKALDKNGKLLLAILVEPHKEENVFEIQSC